MPQAGDKIHARELGKQETRLYTWLVCPECEAGRWVSSCRSRRVMSERNSICHHCYMKHMARRGKYHSSWKGGRAKTNRGYVLIKLQPDDFFYPMADRQGYVGEHRLVVARALGRNLHSWELVHHKGVKYPKGSKEDKADNRYPENLQLVTDERHKQITILERRIQKLEAENRKLREERDGCSTGRTRQIHKK